MHILTFIFLNAHLIPNFRPVHFRMNISISNCTLEMQFWMHKTETPTTGRKCILNADLNPILEVRTVFFWISKFQLEVFYAHLNPQVLARRVSLNAHTGRHSKMQFVYKHIKTLRMQNVFVSLQHNSSTMSFQLNWTVYIYVGLYTRVTVIRFELIKKCSVL